MSVLARLPVLGLLATDPGTRAKPKPPLLARLAVFFRPSLRKAVPDGGRPAPLAGRPSTTLLAGTGPQAAVADMEAWWSE